MNGTEDEKHERQENGEKVRPSLMSTRQKKRAQVSLLAYEIMPGGRLEDCEVHEALQNAPTDFHKRSHSEPVQEQQPQRSFWIDVEIPTSDDLKCLVSHESEILNVLPPFLKRHLLQPSQLLIPQTLVFPRYAMIVLRILPSDSAGFYSYALRHAAAICVKGLLVTITTITSTKPDQMQQSSVHVNLYQSLDLSRHMWDQEIPEASATGALSAWLHIHVMRVSLISHRVRSQILDLCEKMDRDPTSVELSEIVSLKDTLMRVLSIAEEQDEVLQALHEGQSNAFDFSSTIPNSQLKAMLATSGATERQARRLDKRLTYVRTMYESLQQDRINRRLAVLTIVSAIFLPLSLMAGIWGMNFVNMPELERENAYYYALSSMAAVALTQLFIFWRLGWFT